MEEQQISKKTGKPIKKYNYKAIKPDWKIATGRPLLFKSPQELKQRIDSYFARCDKGILRTIPPKWRWEATTYIQQIPYTVSWLAVYLWCDRLTLINYSKQEEFFNTIREAKQKIESSMEENAIMWTWNSTITIFSLKNNFWWKDQQEIEHTWDMNIGLVVLPNKQIGNAN